MNLSTRLVHAFLALAECRSFTRAAEQCHVSQSAFSTMIQNLEGAVGTKLFVRNTRNVSLTPEGELFKQGALEVNESFARLETNLQDHIERKRGRVTVAALPSLAASFLPGIIQTYRKNYPGISIKIFDVLSDACLDLLHSGQVEMAFTAAIVSPKEFNTHFLFGDPFVVACHKNHILASLKSLTVEDLAGQDIIRFPVGSSLRQYLEQLLQSFSGISSTHLEIAGGISTAAGLVACDCGVAVITKLNSFYFQRPDICCIPLVNSDLIRNIYAVTRKGKTLSSAGAGFLDFINDNQNNMSQNDQS